MVFRCRQCSSVDALRAYLHHMCRMTRKRECLFNHLREHSNGLFQVLYRSYGIFDHIFFSYTSHHMFDHFLSSQVFADVPFSQSKPFISLITSYLMIYIERKRSYTIVPLWLNRCDAKKVNVYRFYDYRLHPWPSAIGHRFIGLSHCNLWKYENKRYNYHLWLMENTCGWSPMVFNALHTGQVTTRDRTELMNWPLLSMLLKLILRMASKPNRIDRLSPNAYDNCKFYGKNIDGINQCIKDVIAWLY